jgi:hypothetical protein
MVAAAAPASRSTGLSSRCRRWKRQAKRVRQLWACLALRRGHPGTALSGRPAGAGDYREAAAAGLRHRQPAGEAVADHVAVRRELALGERLDFLVEAPDPRWRSCRSGRSGASRPALAGRGELGPAWLALVPLCIRALRRGRIARSMIDGLDRGDDRRRADGAPAALAARLGVVALHPALALGLLDLASSHRPHQLVLEQPGRGLLHPEPTRQLDRADPALALGQVVEGK